MTAVHQHSWTKTRTPHPQDSSSASSYALGTVRSPQLCLTRPTTSTRDPDYELMRSWRGPRSRFTRVGWSWAGGLPPRSPALSLAFFVWSHERTRTGTFPLFFFSMTAPPTSPHYSSAIIKHFGLKALQHRRGSDVLYELLLPKLWRPATPALLCSSRPGVLSAPRGCKHNRASVLSAHTHVGRSHVHILPHCLPSFPTSPGSSSWLISLKEHSTSPPLLFLNLCPVVFGVGSPQDPPTQSRLTLWAWSSKDNKRRGSCS